MYPGNLQTEFLPMWLYLSMFGKIKKSLYCDSTHTTNGWYNYPEQYCMLSCLCQVYFLSCRSSHKKWKVEWPSKSIEKQKRWNCNHPWDPSKWAREGGLSVQDYFRLKEVRHDLFFGVKPEMGGINFDSIK